MIIKPQPEYELLDSGDEMKLERYGQFTVSRPDPQAIWPKKLSQKEWEKADAAFIKGGPVGRLKNKEPGESGGSDESADRGRWNIHPKAKGKIPTLADGSFAWPINLGSISIYARLTPFKHTGIFPEQLENWRWTEEILKKAAKANPSQKPKILNLFGYSGGASIACAKAGAEVTHVDASRAAISWAKENMLASGLDEKAIRWMLEDAVQFVKKELRRGNTYDGIMMDPPVFGRGAKGEVWKIERDLMPLLEMAYKLLSDTPLFFILNGYASGYSSVAYANNLAVLPSKFGGTIENGELLIEESQDSDSAIKTPRYLPCGIVARWMRS